MNRLRSILINLLNNSVKYTPSGFVKLDIVCSDLNEKPFFIDFRIIDSGIGIKEEELSHLFDAFAQFDQTRNYGKEGTGLGLTLVKGFCTLMNGNIKVESVYGKGSTFTATVEQEILDATPIDTNLIQSHKVKDEFSLGSLRVSEVCSLVVDDNPINCKVISRSMGYYGMDVDIANNGQEAIELCKNKKYDFIFMDAAKGQYIHFLPEVFRLLKNGGVLVSDNVLQDGDIIESHFIVERRNRTIYKRMREYLYELTHRDDLTTAVLPIGDGITVSTKHEK